MTPQTLTQTQIIRALAEALGWAERELDWGVPLARLGHLTGRIGELYVAMMTRGQMADATNQPGYDVVSLDGEHISVKTVTSLHPIQFSASTLGAVHRVVILLIHNDEDTGLTIEEVSDLQIDDLRARLSGPRDGKFTLSTQGLRSRRASRDGDRTLRILDEVSYRDLTVRRFENGSIALVRDGIPLKGPAKPVLRDLARALDVSLQADNGRIKTTHELGAHVIRAIRQA